MLTGTPSPFVPLFTWAYHILSCPCPSWHLLAFLEDLLSEASESYAIWAQMLLAPLDFLRYHDLFTSLGQAFLIPPFLGPKTYFLLLMGQALIFHF